MLLDRIDATPKELANLSHRAQGFPTVLSRYETTLQAQIVGEIRFEECDVVLGVATATRMIDVSAAHPGQDPIMCGNVKQDVVNPNGIWLCMEETDEIKALF